MIWGLAEQLWKKKYKGKITWPEMSNVGSIIRCALAHFVENRKPKLGDNRLFKLLIAESAMVIWILHIERVYKENLPHTREEIRTQWVTRMNECLKIDQALTHKQFDKLVTDKDLVLRMWSGTLKNESQLLDDWIDSSGVLVGIEIRECRVRGRQSSEHP